eukprot:1552182-Rhodomonas_salina.3
MGTVIPFMEALQTFMAVSIPVLAAFAAVHGGAEACRCSPEINIQCLQTRHELIDAGISMLTDKQDVNTSMLTYKHAIKPLMLTYRCEQTNKKLTHRCWHTRCCNAGCMSAFLTTPLDVVKTRIMLGQVSLIPLPHYYSSAITDSAPEVVLSHH